jgi:hypothetical protein
MITNDDSPKWEVFRVVPVDLEAPSPTDAASAAAASSSRQPPTATKTLQLTPPKNSSTEVSGMAVERIWGAGCLSA